MKQSVEDVQFTLILTLVLVVGVIFLFLRNVSSTIIPSLALPLSILGTFIVMQGLGYSLDNLSLMALTLAVGFVVDDAIVVLENIVRHMEMGKSPMQASIDGAKEIGFTVVSMTISLSAVFIPILFMGGIMGRLFHEFAVVMGVAVLISGFISLSLTPMLASRFLKPHGMTRARTPVHDHGGLVRQVARGGTTPGSPGRSASQGDHADDGRDDGRDRVAVRGDPQGVHPRSGHEPDPRVHRRAGRDRLRVAGRAPERACGARRPRPRDRQLHVVGRRARVVHRSEPRPPVHAPEAAQRARLRSTR